MLTLLPDDSWRPQPPLPATRYLVEAVTGPLHDGHFTPPAPKRLAAVVALFDRLERRDRGWNLADGRAMAGGAE